MDERGKRHGQTPSETSTVARWAKEASGKAILRRVTRDGRTIRIVAAQHFSKQAVGFFQEDIASEIHDPSKWIFMVEGANMPQWPGSEVDIITTIAREKGIPVFDPILTPLDRCVIDVFSAWEGRDIPRSALITSATVSILNALRASTANPLPDTKAIATAAAGLGMTQNELYMTLISDNPQPTQQQDEKAISERIKNGLIRTSNF